MLSLEFCNFTGYNSDCLQRILDSHSVAHSQIVSVMGYCEGSASTRTPKDSLCAIAYQSVFVLHCWETCSGAQAFLAFHEPSKASITKQLPTFGTHSSVSKSSIATMSRPTKAKQSEANSSHNDMPDDLLVRPVDRNMKPHMLPLSTYAERQRTKQTPKESHDVLVGADPVWIKRASVDAGMLSAWDAKNGQTIKVNKGGFDIKVIPELHCLNTNHDNITQEVGLTSTTRANKAKPPSKEHAASPNERDKGKAKEMLGYIMQKASLRLRHR